MHKSRHMWSIMIHKWDLSLLSLNILTSWLLEQRVRARFQVQPSVYFPLVNCVAFKLLQETMGFAVLGKTHSRFIKVIFDLCNGHFSSSVCIFAWCHHKNTLSVFVLPVDIHLNWYSSCLGFMLQVLLFRFDVSPWKHKWSFMPDLYFLSHVCTRPLVLSSVLCFKSFSDVCGSSTINCQVDSESCVQLQRKRIRPHGWNSTFGSSATSNVAYSAAGAFPFHLLTAECSFSWCCSQSYNICLL